MLTRPQPYEASTEAVTHKAEVQGRSWPGGSRGPDPPASFKFTFSNDPNPMSFLLGGRGRGMGIGFHPITYFA